MPFQHGDRIEVVFTPNFNSVKHFRGQTGKVCEYRGGEYYAVQLDNWPRGETHIFLQSELVREAWRAHYVIRDYSDKPIALMQTERNFMASSAAYMAHNAQDFGICHYWQERAVRDGIIYG